MNFVESFNLLGTEAKQIPCSTGSGAPTELTEGTVGCFYMDTDTGMVYKCTAADDGIYTWEIMGTQTLCKTAIVIGNAADGATADTCDVLYTEDDSFDETLQVAYDMCIAKDIKTIKLLQGNYNSTRLVVFNKEIDIVGDGMPYIYIDYSFNPVPAVAYVQDAEKVKISNVTFGAWNGESINIRGTAATLNNVVTEGDVEVIGSNTIITGCNIESISGDYAENCIVANNIVGSITLNEETNVIEGNIINGVPQVSGGGSGEIPDNSITPEKTTFFIKEEYEEVSGSYFNPKDENFYEEAYFLNGGSIKTGAGYERYVITGYIPVNAGDVISTRVWDNETNEMFDPKLTGYKSRKIGCYAFKGVQDSNADSIVENEADYKIPEGVNFVRVNCDISLGKFTITINSVPTEYVEYGVTNHTKHYIDPKYIKGIPEGGDDTEALQKAEEALQKAEEALQKEITIPDGSITPKKTSFFVNGGNLFNPNDEDIQYSKYISGKGVIRDHASYNITGYIPVTAGKTLRASVDSTGNGERVEVPLMYWSTFDAAKSPIAGYSYDNYITGEGWTVPDGVAYIRASFAKANQMDENDSFKLQIEDTGMISGYKPYGIMLDRQYNSPNQPVYAYLPDEICVAVGRTIELYNKQVCLNADKYHMQWICDEGYQYDRKFSIEGKSDNIGEYALTLNIYDDTLEKVWEGRSTVKIVSAEITNNMAIVPIGDSLTNAKAWLGELQTLSGNKISLVGTRWHGTTETNGTYRHEGRSGASANWYLNNREYDFYLDPDGVGKENPFYDPALARFSWNYYKTTYSINPDAIILFLGTNNLKMEPEQNGNDIKQIVDYIREDDANIPIYVCNTIYPSFQNGFAKQTMADNYAGNLQGAFDYREFMKIYNLQTYLYNALKDYEGVYFIPLSVTHDGEYNFGSVAVPVNPRSDETTVIPIESIHPQPVGFLQIADVMFSTIATHQNEEI